MTFQAISGLRAVAPAPIAIERLLIGRPVEEAAALLPRIFNLCAGAQRMAIRLALGLDVTDEDRLALGQEIKRDQALQVGVILPKAFDLPALRNPLTLLDLPEMPNPAGFSAFLKGDGHIARLLSEVIRCFEPGDATAPSLPAPGPEGMFLPAAYENSPATAHQSNPLMQWVEREWGRGPLWRVLGLLFSLTSAVETPLHRPSAGLAIVPAARGLYAVEARAEAGRVTSFRRVTPTDHMLVPGGILDHMLSRTPRAKAELALKILNPCQPLTLKDHANA